jgi:hypothetical protein
MSPPTFGGKDEPNIVFMRKSERTAITNTFKVPFHNSCQALFHDDHRLSLVVPVIKMLQPVTNLPLYLGVLKHITPLARGRAIVWKG